MFNWLIGRRGFLAGIAVFLASPLDHLSKAKDITYDNIHRFINWQWDDLSSNGFPHITTIWNRINHEPSLTLTNMLPTQLKKKDEFGNRVFTAIDPMVSPKRGNTHCYVCNKSNILDENHLVLHMQSNHRLEWRDYYSYIHYAGYIEEA